MNLTLLKLFESKNRNLYVTNFICLQIKFFFGWYKTEQHFTRKIIFDIC